MANMYINDMTALWSTGGTTYNAIKMNVTNAASAAASKLLALQVGGVEKYSVSREGAVVASGTVTSAGLIASAAPVPSANDSAGLGTSGTAWSDLFLASGGVINWNAGNVTLTHSTGVLTLGASQDLRLTTAGTDAASAVTVGGTQTLLNKTLTTPVLTTPTINAATLTGTLAGGTFTGTTLTSPTIATPTVTGGTFSTPTLNSPVITGSLSTASPTITGSPTAAGATWADLGTVSTADINGGTIDGAVIGGASAANGTFTTLQVNTSLNPDAAGGATLGTTALGWGNLYLNSASVIDFANNDVRITHATNGLAFTGASSNGYSFDFTVKPAADNTIALGQFGTAWSDLYLGNGAIIDFASGNVQLTHSTGVLTLGASQDLRLTTPGSNTNSVIISGGTQTLSNKTLAAPTITGTATVFAANFSSQVTTPTLTVTGTTTLQGPLDISHASANQIKFASTGGVADDFALDRYEEGTFTPTIVGSTLAGIGTYSFQAGKFTRIGNFLSFSLTIGITAHTGTGNLRISISGLATANVTYDIPVTIIPTNLTFASPLLGRIPQSTSYVDICTVATNAAPVPLVLTADTAFSIVVLGSYLTS